MRVHGLKLTARRVKNAALVLEDGSFFLGYGFGAVGRVSGEVVFNTGMVGYVESLTDPSYHGQILTMTYPLVGNYGVPSFNVVDEWGLPAYFESDGVKVRGFVVHECCRTPSHWNSAESLDEWLRREGVPGIEGVDTRMLTKKLRVKGVMLGILEVCEEGVEPDVDELLKEVKYVEDPNKRKLASEVSCRKPVSYGDGGGKRVVLIDCGVKLSILRQLLRRGTEVVRVPYGAKVDEILDYRPRGVVVSNGPGDPKSAVEVIDAVRGVLSEELPVFGICFGNQILALACGGDTYKLKYGHRSQNQPCIDVETGRCYITSQNHGYAVSEESLCETGLRVSFVNANDKTVEGVRHEKLPAFSVQFHPEHSPGPFDTEHLFDLFMNMLGD
ncbi:MAG: glutamine-hydrolyzing carbamoyl-phosphate synthase small subunit [Candidatus Jordarchaeales archaeon]